MILTTSHDATADYLCTRTARAGINVIRINTDQIALRGRVVASPDKMILVGERWAIEPEGVRCIWYRRPEPIFAPTRGDLAEQRFASLEWGAALEGWLAHVPEPRWINHPSKIMGASFKLEQLGRAARLGLYVPRWLCTSDKDTAVEFMSAVGGAVVSKPLYSGVLERDTAADDTDIFTSQVERHHVETAERSLGCPTLFQERALGWDIRVTIVDEMVWAVRLVRSDGAVDVRRDNMRGVEYQRVALPSGLAERLVRLNQSYGLRFSAIDLIETDRGWTFLELNPNGQWAWLDLVGGAEIFSSFVSAFSSQS